MAVAELLLEGLRIMAIGMGIVFAFLLLLVGALRVMSAAATRMAPEEQVRVPDKAPATADSDGELTAVIAAAVARYRHDRPAGRRQE